MSIFNETIPSFVQNEIELRKKNITSNRTKGINTEISKIAWVRMTSGVDTIDDKGNISNELAKNNVITSILGGNKNDNYSFFLKGYSNSFNGTSNRHGIRPLPGIESLSCQSYSANGSLRKITIKFVCWDLAQLDVLEKLYMRPGYPLCIEWGWSHKLGENTTLIGYPKFGEKFLESKISNLLDLYKEAYNEVIQSNGNFDITIGKIQNYNFSARKDGGYNCETTIVTYGEILDSLKINFIPFETNLPESGILGTRVEENVNDKYAEGIIPGICQELYQYANKQNKITEVITVPIPNVEDEIKLFAINLENIQPSDPNNSLAPENSKLNVYIQFASLLALINWYILPKNGKGNMTQYSWYDDKNTYFKCLAHQLQFSTDPKVCLINPEGWLINPESINDNSTTEESTPPISILDENSLQYKLLTSINDRIGSNSNDYFLQLVNNKIEQSGNILNSQTYVESVNSVFNDLLNYAKITYDGNETTYNFYPNTGLTGNILYTYKSTEQNKINYLNFLKASENLYGNSYELTNYKEKYKYITLCIASKIEYIQEGDYYTAELGDISKDTFFKPLIVDHDIPDSIIIKNTPQNIQTVSQQFEKAGLGKLTPFFVQNSGYRLGYLPNIYINLDYIYRSTKSTSVETDDKLRKNEISANKFLTNLLIDIQNNLGSINDFQLYGDSIDNKIKIIDRKCVENIIRNNTGKNNIFAFEVDNISSTTLEYSMKSQIFPEQSAQVAISAQARSGYGGYENRNLIDYNDGIISRIAPEIVPGAVQTNATNNTGSNDYVVGKAIGQIAAFNSSVYNIVESSEATSTNQTPGLNNNILRDLIGNWDAHNQSNDRVYFSPIPVVVSLEMIGIAGMKIGNLFDINGGNKTRILPASFKLKGKDVAFLIKSLSHNISNNVWTTTIEGYPFVIPSKET